MKVFEALHNPMVYESSAGTLSVHRTREGAEKAIAAHKAKEKAEHDEMYSNERLAESELAHYKKYPKPAFDEHQWWGVNEIEIQD